MARRDIIVVGASAGGIEALRSLTRQLPAGLPATVLVVVHIASAVPSQLAEIFSKVTPLKTAQAAPGQVLSPGHLYFAPPDLHMLVHDGHIHLTRGPRENRVRPAIDPLFRSAAVHAGPRVIGIVLTGFLDDGAAGLLAVKRCGGTTIVQDPQDAENPDMPRSAIRAAPPDFILPVSRMGLVLEQLTREEVSQRFLIPPDLAGELSMNLEMSPDDQRLNAWGELVAMNCPECGGPIWEHRDGGMRRYRCLVGHAFSGKTMLAEQSVAVEEALWTGVQKLEEHARTLARLAEDEERSGNLWMAFAEQAAATREKAQVVRSLLTSPEPQQLAEDPTGRPASHPD